MYEKASYDFYRELESVNINEFDKIIYSNVKGLPYDESDDIKELLRKQIMSPVLFEKSIKDLIERGVDTFIEIGPGKVLCGFVNKINKNMNTYNVQDLESLKDTVKKIKS